MFEMNWDKFKGNLIIKGKTIKDWCSENSIDIDRYRNIRNGRVQATEEEITQFNKVLEG